METLLLFYREAIEISWKPCYMIHRIYFFNNYIEKLLTFKELLLYVSIVDTQNILCKSSIKISQDLNHIKYLKREKSVNNQKQYKIQEL